MCRKFSPYQCYECPIRPSFLQVLSPWGQVGQRLHNDGSAGSRARQIEMTLSVSIFTNYRLQASYLILLSLDFLLSDMLALKVEKRTQVNRAQSMSYILRCRFPLLSPSTVEEPLRNRDLAGGQAPPGQLCSTSAYIILLAQIIYHP